MDRLKKSRKPFRTQMTKLCNEVKTILEGDNIDNTVLFGKLQVMEAVNGQLVEIDSKIMDQMVDDNVTDDEQDKEFTDIHDYKEKYEVARRSITIALEPRMDPQQSDYDTASSVGGAAADTRRNFKLPEISLKKFGGDLKQWLGWWSQFEKIHKDAQLHDSDKFQYLVSSMAPGSEAAELVDGYVQTADNYQEVITALEERYGRQDLLLQVYVRELLTLVISNVTNKVKTPLPSLYLKLESHLRSLAALNLASADPATWLFPLVESSLAEETMRAWQRSPLSKEDGSKRNPPKTKLDLLMEFIKTEVRGEQQITLAQSGFQSCSLDAVKKSSTSSRASRKPVPEEVPTAAGLLAGQSSGCAFCERNHDSDRCGKALSMTLQEKKQKLQDKRLCYQCLKPGHNSRKCRVFVKCALCGGKHYPVVCFQSASANAEGKKAEKENTQKNAPSSTSSDTTPSQPVGVPSSASNSNQCSGDILLYSGRANVIGEDGTLITVRIVADTGSQRSYIRNRILKQVKCLRIGNEWLKNIVFGASVTPAVNYGKYQVTLRSLDGSKQSKFNLLQKNEITGRTAGVPIGPWTEKLQEMGIQLSDFKGGYHDVDILIGQDHWGSLITGRIVKLTENLHATETIFGWMLGGPLHEDETSAATAVTSMLVSNTDISHLWSMEAIGIRDPIESKTENELEREAQEHFSRTVTRDHDGRYIVALPWKDDVSKLPSNRSNAEKRLKRETAKLIQHGKWKDYDQVFKSWEEEGLITITDSEEGFFNPHRPVYKDSPTTPVRPVFDASCKSGRNPSLNECLHKGPNLLERIPVVILRFREEEVGVISDIRKAYQMLLVRERDRKYQKFLWWEDESCSKVKIIQHNRVMFGLSASAFLLGATINHHLDLTSIKEKHVKTVPKMRKGFYVDNLATSVGSVEEYEKFRKEATEIMESARMDLRQWARSLKKKSSDGELVTDRCLPVLGLVWDRVEDTLSCVIKGMDDLEKITKRKITSVVARMFDPLGITCPAMIPPKLIIQDSWIKKFDWDEALPDDVHKKFLVWHEELQFLEQIRIPRHYQFSEATSREVFVFCDSSLLSYAAVAFMRSEHYHGVNVQLLMAKSRLAPCKKATIPRLELCACVIGTRLASVVKSAMDSKDVPFSFWSDSTTALAWIRRDGDWGVFVSNRVKEVLNTTEAGQWKHVPGIHNPADLPSRGCSPAQLLKSRWWEGPSWLRMSRDNFPVSQEDANEHEVSLEMKKVCTSISLQLLEQPKFSSYRKNVAVVGWLLRFIKLKVLRMKTFKTPILSIMEMREAEKVVIRKIQNSCFGNAQVVSGGICVFKDEDGLLRVKTRLLNRKDTSEFISPILMPKDHPMTSLLILDFHLYYGHAGIQFIMSKLREKYWIIQSRRTIRRVLKQCTTCQRYTAKPLEVVPAALPEKRVQNCEAFQTTGVDLAGPLFLKDGSKAWVVLFTCAVYRCVYLDVVTSLSTEAFLGALERFISMHGRPNTVYSDNGTNFVGAVNIFKQLNWEEIQQASSLKQIQWIFNPPSGAWWGGWWERLVRSMKDLLKRMLGRSRLSYDQLRTCLAGVCATMNDRPLTAVTEDHEDLKPLTPGMFIRRGNGTFSETGEVSSLTASYRRMKYLQTQLQDRFRKEYLAQLVQRGNEKGSEVVVGDVVLVGSENRKRFDWPLGRIVELFPGRDKKVRVARVKTQFGILTRPLQRLYPLEISNADSLETPLKKEEPLVSHKKVDNVIVTRKGRVIKSPARYGQCLSFIAK